MIQIKAVLLSFLLLFRRGEGEIVALNILLSGRVENIIVVARG
jgi:hypothetical protein